jgi:hypothetical protein
MARLPVPGSDDGSWGDILNSFLQTSHNSDGTLSSSALQQAGAITSVNGKQTTNGSVTLNANDVGAVQIAGDLGGTATSPTVSKIQGTTINVPPGGSTEYLRADGAWSSPAAQVPYLPSDDGLLAVNWDPAINTGDGNPNNGTIFLCRIPIRVACTASNLVLGLGGAASSSASTGTYVGLYKLSGNQLNLLTGSSDMGVSLAAGATQNNAIALPFTTPQNLNAGDIVYGAFVINMTNNPAFWNTSAQRGGANMGVGTWQRLLVISNGNTSLQNTITPADLSNVGFYSSPWWMGIS